MAHLINPPVPAALAVPCNFIAEVISLELLLFKEQSGMQLRAL